MSVTKKNQVSYFALTCEQTNKYSGVLCVLFLVLWWFWCSLFRHSWLPGKWIQVEQKRWKSWRCAICYVRAMQNVETSGQKNIKNSYSFKVLSTHSDVRLLRNSLLLTFAFAAQNLHTWNHDFSELEPFCVVSSRNFLLLMAHDLSDTNFKYSFTFPPDAVTSTRNQHTQSFSSRCKNTKFNALFPTKKIKMFVADLQWDQWNSEKSFIYHEKSCLLMRIWDNKHKSYHKSLKLYNLRLR